MDKTKAKEYLRFLDEKYSEWYTQSKQRSRIAEEIRSVAQYWDDEIYLYLNDGRATGLFKHGFFESDVQKSLSLLKGIVDEGTTPSENKFFKIYNILEKYQIDEKDLVRKELRDYLIEKIHNGELANRKITFRDVEDYEYFSKLVSSIGIDPNGLLEEIVLSAFSES